MRDFLDSILTFIGAPSLTTEEFETFTANTQTYTQLVYDELSSVLESRESISTLHDKLVSFFNAKGVDVTATSQSSSNILVGGGLE